MGDAGKVEAVGHGKLGGGADLNLLLDVLADNLLDGKITVDVVDVIDGTHGQFHRVKGIALTQGAETCGRRTL